MRLSYLVLLALTTQAIRVEDPTTINSNHTQIAQTDSNPNKKILKGITKATHQTMSKHLNEHIEKMSDKAEQAEAI